MGFKLGFISGEKVESTRSKVLIILILPRLFRVILPPVPLVSPRLSIAPSNKFPLALTWTPAPSPLWRVLSSPVLIPPLLLLRLIPPPLPLKIPSRLNIFWAALKVIKPLVCPLASTMPVLIPPSWLVRKIWPPRPLGLVVLIPWVTIAPRLDRSALPAVPWEELKFNSPVMRFSCWLLRVILPLFPRLLLVFKLPVNSAWDAPRSIVPPFPSTELVLTCVMAALPCWLDKFTAAAFLRTLLVLIPPVAMLPSAPRFTSPPFPVWEEAWISAVVIVPEVLLRSIVPALPLWELVFRLAVFRFRVLIWAMAPPLPIMELVSIPPRTSKRFPCKSTLPPVPAILLASKPPRIIRSWDDWRLILPAFSFGGLVSEVLRPREVLMRVGIIIFVLPGGGV